MARLSQTTPLTPEQATAFEALARRASEAEDADAVTDLLLRQLPPVWYGRPEAKVDWSLLYQEPLFTQSTRARAVRDVVEAALLNPSVSPFVMRDVPSLLDYWPILSRNPALMFWYAASEPALGWLASQLYQGNSSTPGNIQVQIVMDRHAVDNWDDDAAAIADVLRAFGQRLYPWLPPIPAVPRTPKGRISYTKMERWGTDVHRWQLQVDEGPTREATMDARSYKSEAANIIRSRRTGSGMTGIHVDGLSVFLLLGLRGNEQERWTYALQTGVPNYIALARMLAERFEVSLPRHLLSDVISSEPSV